MADHEVPTEMRRGVRWLVQRARRRVAGDVQRDAGMSLIEVIISVVLLAGAGSGVLATMAASITGSSRNDDRSEAISWLQSTADYLMAQPFVSCTTGNPTAPLTAYNAALQTNAAPAPPDGWTAALATVQSPVLSWNGTAFGDTCVPASQLQLVVIKITAPSPNVTETLEIVKGKWQNG